MDNNGSSEPEETLAEVVLPDPNNKPPQPTITVSCGENGEEGMDGVTVNEVTAGKVFEEKEVKVDPLGKKVVIKGQEE